MKNSELRNILVEKCKELDLKGNAFALFENIFTQNSVNELTEIFGELNRESIHPEFENYSFYISKNETSIRTRLNIKNTENDQIGWYEIVTNFNGDFLDEFLNLF
ncbi:hypothetical protein ACFS5J_00245 [Flavobacterium chuncheonense]|uniref:Uncharacterized protein n=1 Tax=Flavobacterium chuncheonense TaxID=2026653 RepID=A0ABW5YHH3_9FLAO